MGAGEEQPDVMWVGARRDLSLEEPDLLARIEGGLEADQTNVMWAGPRWHLSLDLWFPMRGP